MPPGRKPSRTREDFVAAAIAFADENGLQALTLQALGASLGASTTAIYRYFRDKDDLIVAMREALLGQALAAPADIDDPRQLIVAAALAFRAVARAHPCLGQLMVLPTLDGPNAAAVPMIIVRELARLGLQGPLLVRGYRQLESLVVGASVFDFSGAPTHLEDRLARLRQLGDPTFDAVLASAADVDADNEAAFAATLTSVIDALVDEAGVPESG